MIVSSIAVIQKNWNMSFGKDVSQIAVPTRNLAFLIYSKRFDSSSNASCWIEILKTLKSRLSLQSLSMFDNHVLKITTDKPDIGALIVHRFRSNFCFWCKFYVKSKVFGAFSNYEWCKCCYNNLSGAFNENLSPL